MAQWVKYMELLLQHPGLLLGHRFNPRPRNFHLPRVWQKKKERKVYYLDGPDLINEVL